MANLQIKGIEDDLYEEIKKMAAAENRSISQQVLFVVKSYISRKAHWDVVKSPAEVLIDLHGSWQDEREADQIIEQVKHARRNSKSLAKGF
jgi:predicted CopG family antitoxin